MRKYFLLISYVVACTLIGKEFHPFSQFPMYSSFPNYAYAFALKDGHGQLVPYLDYFTDKNAGFVAHRYSSFFNYHNYTYGFGHEDPAQAKQAGKELMGMILQGENPRKLNFDTLYLYRRFYYLTDDTITYRDDLIYAQGIRP